VSTPIMRPTGAREQTCQHQPRIGSNYRSGFAPPATQCLPEQWTRPRRDRTLTRLRTK
jgi:hypothetical protein